ncbi:hypothetical protein [Blastopirellula marina]|uniref:AsmA-like C-terminal domain-containing protein n=1 Tax=Blastopirellula marina DSM 3645 TaxID=314230 RepID=A3ZNT8_9BACT|nr:hypothetical protein [Blastopirellula marina]EAQ81986.1 hypothetical protein DSM3645_17580 [Blastopirellula marina DSM 3645]
MTAAPLKKRRRRWWVFSALAALLLFIAFLPTLASYRPLTQGGLSAVLAATEVEVFVDRVSFGWLAITQIEGLQIRQREGKFNVSVPQMSNDVYFWQLIANPRQLGNLEIIQPDLHFVIQKPEDSLIDSIADEPTPLDPEKLTEALNRQISVNIRDATLSAQRPGGAAWKIEHFELSGKLTPATSQQGPLLRLDHIQAMDHFQLTEEMCDDLLKYAVPIMHGVTNIHGEASLRFEAWEFPLENPQQGTGRGSLEIHEASLVSGPILKSITDALQMAPSVQIASNCKVKFKLADGRVYHEGLELGFPNCRVRTSGWVGLDDTLDILCVIPIPVGDSIDETLPLLQSLQGKTIRLRITGTLQQPQVGLDDTFNQLAQTFLGASDGGAIPVDQVLSAASGMLQKMRKGAPSETLDRLRKQQPLPMEPADLQRPLGGLFDRLRQGLGGVIETVPLQDEAMEEEPPPPRPESPGRPLDL